MPRDSSSRASASGASTSPIGTLSQKIQCQETPLTIAPPTSGPSAIASPPMPPQIPSASPRRSRGTPAERIVSVSGVTIAPPTPCTARATSSAFGGGRERGGGRGAGEEEQAEREQPAAAEAVAERRPGEEQHRERERVRVHRPLELRDRRVQVAPDHRDRGRDDEVVEADHEERDRGDGQRPDVVRF